MRAAAARALGKSGNGKLIHDALYERLVSGSEMDQIDCMQKLSSLGRSFVLICHNVTKVKELL